MGQRIALAPFLLDCPSVHTLGVRPCMEDYDPRERELLRNADRVFFPTQRYVDVFDAASIPTFPSPSCHRYARSRVLQTLLFQQLSWPGIGARLYFGRRSRHRILDECSIPFEVLPTDPRRSKLCTVRIPEDLEAVMKTGHPLVVRRVVPWEDRLRLISIQYECVAVQRVRNESDPPRDISSESASIRDLDVLLTMNRTLTRKALLDDIAVEWGLWDDRWHPVEMSPPPLHIRRRGHSIRRHAIICDLILRGLL